MTRLAYERNESSWKDGRMIEDEVGDGTIRGVADCAKIKGT